MIPLSQNGQIELQMEKRQIPMHKEGILKNLIYAYQIAG